MILLILLIKSNLFAQIHKLQFALIDDETFGF